MVFNLNCYDWRIKLVICSLDRVVPLYRALNEQRVNRQESFLKKQRLFNRTEVSESEKDFEMIKKRLKEKRYHIREENGNIFAEKGHFSRWGPYVNHAGLIIFLIGGKLRFVPGMYVDEVLWLRDGETKTIPGTNEEYVLESKGFKRELYDKEVDNELFDEAIDRVGLVIKNFQSDVVLYQRDPNQTVGDDKRLIKLKDAEIRVNEPLKFDKFAIYQ